MALPLSGAKLTTCSLAWLALFLRLSGAVREADATQESPISSFPFHEPAVGAFRTFLLDSSALPANLLAIWFLTNRKPGAASVLATKEFTVHISDYALVDQMEICSIKFPADVDELALAGLETVPGETVRSPRILAAPVAFECHLMQTIPVSSARTIILGEVKRMYVRETLMDPESHYVDQIGIDAVGRLGGHLYARQLDQFERVTPTVEEFMGFAAKAG